jgi:hypothetical protein
MKRKTRARQVGGIHIPVRAVSKYHTSLWQSGARRCMTPAQRWEIVYYWTAVGSMN